MPRKAKPVHIAAGLNPVEPSTPHEDLDNHSHVAVVTSSHAGAGDEAEHDYGGDSDDDDAAHTKNPPSAMQSTRSSRASTMTSAASTNNLTSIPLDTPSASSLCASDQMHFTDEERTAWAAKVSAPLDGWEYVTQEPTKFLWKKKMEASDLFEIRGLMYIHAPPQLVCHALFHTKERIKWDSNFEYLSATEITEEPKGDSMVSGDLLYSIVKTPFPLTTRDVLQRRDCIESLDGKEWTYMYKSILDNEHHPLKPNFVRAEANGIFVGDLYHPQNSTKPTEVIHDKEETIPWTRVKLWLKADMKGSIPAFLINVVAPHLSAKWYDEYMTYCEKAARIDPKAV